VLRSNSRFIRVIVLAVVVAAALAGSSCGDDEQPTADEARNDRPAETTGAAPSSTDEELPTSAANLPAESPHPVTRALKRIRKAFVANDIEGLCDLMTEPAQLSAGRSVHGTPTTCPRDVKRLFGAIAKGDGWQHKGLPRVTGMTLDGNEATALVALGQQLAEIPFAKVGGRWKLNGFFGSPTSHAERFVAEIRNAPWPPARPADALGDTRVKVRDAAGGPCPKLSYGAFPQGAGGCEIHAASEAPIELSVLTGMGDFTLEKCLISYRVLADRAGRTWTDTFAASGAPKSACGDVDACFTKKGTLMPWKGRLRSDGEGGFIHRMNMCLNTCVGSFTGDLVMHMQPEGKGWRTEPVNGGGQSGFRFEGPLTIVANGVEIEGAGIGGF
jgi:hypothetical protein